MREYFSGIKNHCHQSLIDNNERIDQCGKNNNVLNELKIENMEQDIKLLIIGKKYGDQGNEKLTIESQ